MKYYKLIIGFLASIGVLIFIGAYVLHIDNQILTSLAKGEKHFKTVTTAATEISSSAKRAEGHLHLYLLLHRDIDKNKYPQRVALLQKHINILDQNIEDTTARRILEKIKNNSSKIESLGEKLINNHGKKTNPLEALSLENENDIQKLHTKFSSIRELGIELATFEIQRENDIKISVMKNASRLHSYLLILLVFTSLFLIFLGYLLVKTLKNLNNEIAERIQSEKAIQLEKDKLNEALEKVKVLHGLLPICASCKKIRDDKGYWNQIEKYLGEHADVEFTHGICPECAKKLYPNLKSTQAEKSRS